MYALISGMIDEDGFFRRGGQFSQFSIPSQATVTAGPPSRFTLPITNPLGIPYGRISAVVSPFGGSTGTVGIYVANSTGLSPVADQLIIEFASPGTPFDVGFIVFATDLQGYVLPEYSLHLPNSNSGFTADTGS